MADAAKLLAEPVALVELRPEPHRNDAVAHAGERTLEPGLGFEHHLADALAVVEARRGQHVGEDGTEFLGLLGHGLGAQEQPGRGAAAVAPGRIPPLRTDPAGLAADALRQRHEILPRGPGLQQRPREHRQQRQQRARHARKVEAEVEIEDAAGRQRMREQPHPAQRLPRDGDRLLPAGQIGERQRRNPRQRLGGIGFLLQRLEPGGARGDFGQLLRRHGRLRRIEPRPLLGGLARRLAGIGVEQHGRAVRVGEQVLLDQRLEHPVALGDAGLQRSERRLEAERLQRIAAVQPGAHGAEHEGDAARERAGIVLAQLELDGIERRRDGVGVDAVPAQRLERRQDQRLDAVGIGLGDALEADGEIGLAEVLGEAAPGQPHAEAGICLL